MAMDIGITNKCPSDIGFRRLSDRVSIGFRLPSDIGKVYGQDGQAV